MAAKKTPARKVPLTAAERSFVEAPRPSAPPKPKGSAPPKPRPSAAQALEGSAPRSTVARADGRTLRRIQLYFDLAVAKKLRLHCAEHELDMSAFVNQAVKKALG